jgi:hypothetical protein
MRLVHRISLRMTASQRRELEALGLKVPAGIALPGAGDPLVAFDVDEDHPNWSALRVLFQQWDAGDFIRTKFSKKEVAEARWLELVPDWHHGYPQPDEEVVGYLRATYDLTDFCEKCGVGLRQRAPFQMKGEPKWGRNGILQLNWIFDEYFVTPEVWATVLKPLGIGCRPVMSAKDIELHTVVQLVAEEEVGVVTDGLAGEECSSCGRMKYLPVMRGPFPSLVSEPSRAMVKTREYFGSGAAAYQGVLVSQECARALTTASVRGASVKPVQSVIGTP